MKRTIMRNLMLSIIAVIMVFGLVNPMEADAATTPYKVTGVKVSSVNFDTVRITWSSSKYASGYKVYRATSKYGKYTCVRKTTSRSYTNTKLTTGKTYYYKVRAYRGSRNGKYSVIRSIKPIPSMVALKASSGTSGVSLSWGKIAGASGYQIYRATGKSGTYSKLGTSKNLTYKNTSGTLGRTYYYKVRAYRTYKGKTTYGYFSSVKSGNRMLKSPVVKCTSNIEEVGLSWGSVSGASRYYIYRDGENLGSVNGNSFVDDEVSVGERCSYRVKAISKYGNASVYSNTIEVTVEAKPLPKPGTPVLKSTDSIERVVLSWGSVGNAEKYEVYRDGKFLYMGTNKSYIDTDVVVGSSYSYKVRGLNKDGNGDFSGEIKVTVKAKPLPKPTTPSLSYEYKDGKVVLSWDSVANASEYELYKGDKSLYRGTDRTYTDSSVVEGETYSYKVRGLNKDCEGDFSGVITVAIPKNEEPEPPVEPEVSLTLSTPVVGVSVGEDMIVVSWQKIEGATSYEVYKDGVRESIVTATSYKDRDIVEGTEYAYKVRAFAYDDKGVKVYSEYSSSVSGVVPVPPAPIVVGTPNLNLTKNAESITLTWGSVENATAYEVYRNDKKITDIVDTSYEDKNIVKGTEYSYKVRAYNGSGDVVYGEYSNSVSGVIEIGDIGTIEPTDPSDPLYREDCYIDYCGVRIHIGEKWSESLNAAINRAVGGSGVLAKFTTRYYGSQPIDVYLYDISDYSDFMILYVYNGHVYEWMTTGKNMGFRSGMKLVKGNSTVGYNNDSESSLGSRDRVNVSLWVKEEVSSGSGDYRLVMGGLCKSVPACSSVTKLSSNEDECAIAEHTINALRVANGKSILKHNEELYTLSTMPYTKWMVDNNDLTHGDFWGRVDEFYAKTSGRIELVSENISSSGNTITGERMAKGWYESEGHRINMLKDGNCMAVAMVKGDTTDAYETFQLGREN